MKLDKTTRDKVGVGTILCSDGFECKVVNVTKMEYGKRIALDVLKSNIPWMVGRRIYSAPLSNYYGMEIKE